MLLLRSSTVLTGRPGGAVDDGEVLVDGSRVVAVGRRGEVPLPAGAPPEVVDLPGHTLMPGMIDCHVHLGFDASPDPVTRMKLDDDQRLLLRMADAARRLLRTGVTTARDLGGRSWLDVWLRDAIAGGDVAGTQLVVATRPITTTGGHCWFMGCGADERDEVERAARDHLAHGADCLKIMATGGFMTRGSAPWRPQYDVDCLRAAADVAHEAGTHIAAHAHGTEGIRRAVAAGVDTIEHCSWAGESGRVFDPATAERMAEQGTFVSPTASRSWTRQVALRGEAYVEERVDHLRRLREAGVRIAASTDAGINNLPFEAYVDGLEWIARTGMTNDEVIEAATAVAAEAIGLGEVTGTLEPGKRADVIAVQGDPRSDLGALRRVALVMTAGRRHDPATL